MCADDQTHRGDAGRTCGWADRGLPQGDVQGWDDRVKVTVLALPWLYMEPVCAQWESYNPLVTLAKLPRGTVFFTGSPLLKVTG